MTAFHVYIQVCDGYNELRMESQTDCPVQQKRVSRVLIVAVVAASYAILNELGANAQIVPGVSIIFPGTALAIASIYHFRWPAAVGIFLGTLITPWGTRSGFAEFLIYYLPMGLINVLEGLIPALIFRFMPNFHPALKKIRDILVFLLFGCLLNTGFSAVAGNLLRYTALSKSFSMVSIQVWWLADGIAALTLGLPLFLLIEKIKSHKSVIDGPEDWADHNRQRFSYIIVMISLITVIVYVTAVFHIGSYHIFAVLFVIPLLWANWTYGLCGGSLINGIIAICYVLVALFSGTHHIASFPRLTTYDQFVTTYLFLFFFTLITLYGGHLADQKRLLMGEISMRRKEIEQDFLSAVCALSSAIEAKEPDTVEHLRRVADYAVRIGERMGIDEKGLRTIEYAAVLHDVGKIGIPEQILLKPEPLTPEERELMQKHVSIGAKIIENVHVLSDALPLILHHQERWDGDLSHPNYPAYPKGLKEDDIPMGARIIAVVDAFDAMISQRPYRNPLGYDQACHELRREAGRQFDPVVVQTFLEILEENNSGEPLPN